MVHCIILLGLEHEDFISSGAFKIFGLAKVCTMNLIEKGIKCFYSGFYATVTNLSQQLNLEKNI